MFYVVKGKENYEKLLKLGFKEVTNNHKTSDEVYTMLAPKQLNFADISDIPIAKIPYNV